MPGWTTSFGTSLEWEEFNKSWANSTVANISTSSSSSSIATTTDGSTLFIASGYGNFKIDNTNVSSVYGKTSFLVSLKDGNILWSKVLNKSDLYDVLHLISKADNEGNHIVASYDNIYKFSKDGAQVWQRPFPYISGRYGHRRSLSSFDDGSFIVTGIISGEFPLEIGNEIVQGKFKLSHTFKGTGYIAKADQDGNFIWAKEIDSSAPISTGYKEDLKTFDDGSFVLTHREYEYANSYSQPFLGEWVKKYDQNGDLIWSIFLKGGFAEALEVSDTGGVFVSARSEKADFAVGDEIVVFSDFDDTYRNSSGVIVSLSDTGNINWITKTKNVIEGDLKYDTGVLMISSRAKMDSMIGDAKLIDGEVFLSELSADTGMVKSTKGFGDTDTAGSEIDIINSETLAIAGIYSNRAAQMVAGESLIDLDREHSAFVGNIKSDGIQSNSTPAPVPSPSPEPTLVLDPTPTPEPKPEPYDGIIKSVRGKGKLKGTKVADAFTFDSFDVFTKKAADKIISFDASEGDTIAVSQYAFPALQGASELRFAFSNKKKELKILSRQDYDFVYFEKKGRLYFDGNDSRKKWGDSSEGGLVAILKGKPELTASDFTLLV